MIACATGRRCFLGFLSLGAGVAVTLLAVWWCEPQAVADAIGRAAVALEVVEGTETHWLREARELSRRRPEEEARANVLRGDYRFAGRLGLGLVVPGFEFERDEARAQKYGSFIVDAGGCVTDSPEHERFREAAWNFAKRYNLALEDALRKLERERANPTLQPTGSAGD